MAERLVVLGADAAGMTAASQARKRRRDPADLQIVAFDRGRFASQRGIPYWIAGDLEHGADQLIARTPEEHRKNGIDLRMRTEVEESNWTPVVHCTIRRHGDRNPSLRPALAIGLRFRSSRPAGHGCGSILRGPDPRRRGSRARGPRPGSQAETRGRVGGRPGSRWPRRWFGTASTSRSWSRWTTMSTLDPDMGRLIHVAMEDLGIDVQTRSEVEGLDTDRRARPGGVHPGVPPPQNIVVLA